MDRPAETPAFLPYGRQQIEDDDIAAVAEVLRGEFLTTGPKVAQFEQALAARIGARDAVVCANGTAALHMAAQALNLGKGSRIIVPTVTFLATANAPHLNGAEICFADVDPETGLMRPEDLHSALNRAGHADAVFNVHLSGQCGEVEEIHHIASKAGAVVVDDACHALGADYRAADGTLHPIGANLYAQMSVFSFHPVKTIAMGEGGAVSVNDPASAQRLRLARSHGMRKEGFINPDAYDDKGAVNPWYYEMQAPAFNWRASDVQSALGLSQLAKLDRFITKRRALAALYDQLLAPLAPVLCCPLQTEHSLSAWHLYAVRIDFARAGLSRAQLMRCLHEDGIGTQVHYFPVHRQPYYAQLTDTPHLSGAERYYSRTLSLPLFPAMTELDVVRVVESLSRHLAL